MGQSKQRLQSFFGAFANLLHNILDFLELVIQNSHLFGQFLVLAERFATLFFYRKRIIRPPFLVIGFEGDPFLPEVFLGQALNLGNFIYAAFYFLRELIHRLLRAFDGALRGVQGLQGRLDIAGLAFDELETRLPFFPNPLSLYFTQRLRV